MPERLGETPHHGPIYALPHWSQRLARACVLILLLFSFSGCSWKTESGRAYLVLGLGVVTVNTPPESPAANAAVAINHHRAGGLLLGAGPGHTGLLLGFIDYQSIICDPDANALIETITYSDGKFEARVGLVTEDAPTPEKRKDHAESSKPK